MQGLLVSLDEAGEQRSPCLAKRRKSFRTCDSSSHTLHSPKCSPPPTLLAPALSPDGGCMPAAAPTKHPRTSSAGVFPLASPSGPPSFLSAQQVCRDEWWRMKGREEAMCKSQTCTCLLGQFYRNDTGEFTDD
eukprot:1156191-Pelagomonas_calceolata.AAC.8